MGQRIPQATQMPQLTPEQYAYYQKVFGLAPKELQDAEFRAPLGEDQGRKTTGEASLSSQAGGKSTQALEQSEYDRIMQRIAENPTPGIKQQRDDLGLVRGSIGKLGGLYQAREEAGHNLNLRPLMGLLDDWYGGNREKNYVNPGEKAKAELMQLAQLESQMGGQLSAQELSLLKAQLTDQQTEAMKSAFGVGRTAQEGTAGQQSGQLSPAGQMAHMRWLADRAAGKEEKTEKKNDAVEEKVFNWTQDRAKKYNDVSVHLDNINNILGQIGDKATHYETEIPGVGKLSIKKQFDILNQFDDPLVRQYKQSAEDLIKEIRRHNYGTAQSGQEIKSLKAVTGQSIFSTPDQGVSFFQNLDKTLKKAAQDEVNSLPDDWRERYKTLDTTKFENEFGGRTFTKSDKKEAPGLNELESILKEME